MFSSPHQFHNLCLCLQFTFCFSPVLGDHHELIKLFVWLNWISEMLIFVNAFFILYLFIFNLNCFTDPILSGMSQGVFCSQ